MFLIQQYVAFVLDCITIDSVIIINISTVLNLRRENFSMKSKCKCGDVFGFKIIEALRLIGEPEREQALRRFVTSTKRGCAGRLKPFLALGRFLAAFIFKECSCQNPYSRAWTKVQ